MAVPRPLLLGVLGLLLVVATFTATQHARKQTSDAATSAQPVPAPKPHRQVAKRPAKAAAKPAEKHAAPAAHERATHSAKAVHHRTRPVHRVAKPAHRHAHVSGPAAVTRAIEHHRVVVLAFFQSGADDHGVKEAVAALRHRHLAAVFTDRLDHIGRYGPIVGKLGIAQAPAIAIVDTKRRARLIEGYVDPESLAQEVADARR